MAFLARFPLTIFFGFIPFIKPLPGLVNDISSFSEKISFPFVEFLSRNKFPILVTAELKDSGVYLSEGKCVSSFILSRAWIYMS